jgi:beta-N-acetylglucosaminidase
MSNKIFLTITIPICAALLALAVCLGQPIKENQPTTPENDSLVSEPETVPPEIDIPIVEESEKEICQYEECLLCPSDVSTEELAAALKYDLVPLAPYFLEAEELYGVNACYLASIAALESGWGRYQFRKNNLFGFGQMSFDSPEECIYYVAEFLATNYLSENGRYFGGGYKLQHVNKYYNGSDDWLYKVNSIYKGILKSIEESRN